MFHILVNLLIHTPVAAVGIAPQVRNAKCMVEGRGVDALLRVCAAGDLSPVEFRLPGGLSLPFGPVEGLLWAVALFGQALGPFRIVVFRTVRIHSAEGDGELDGYSIHIRTAAFAIRPMVTWNIHLKHIATVPVAFDILNVEIPK